MRKVRFSETLALFVGLSIFSGCGSSKSSMSTPPSADFTLTVSSSSVFVPIGVGSSSLQLSVKPVNGFNQAVTISISGMPAGVSTTPKSPFKVNAGASQTVVFSATKAMLAGLQQVSFQAASGSLLHSSPVSVSVANPVYAYVPSGYPNSPPNDIVGFAVDANTGSISAVQGGPTVLPNPPLDVAVASEPGGAFIFALTWDGDYFGARTLSSFKVDPASGSLAAVQTINYQPQEYQANLAVHPTGKFLYVTQGGCIQAYIIDPATGLLTQSSCSAQLPSGPFVVAPPGHFAYTATNSDLNGQMLIYSVNQTDGSLTLLNSLPAWEPNSALVSDPLGRALYQLGSPFTIQDCGGHFFIWTIDPNTGLVTQVTTSFGPSLCIPYSITFTPDDGFGYVTAKGIYAGAVDPSSGNLTNVPGSPFAASSGYNVVEPTQGKFLIGIGGVSQLELVAYTIDLTTGALSQVSGAGAPFTSSFPFKMVIVAPPN